MKIEIAVINAFTLHGNGGNAAGVVCNAEGLDEVQMQAIATRMALSETAFILPATEADVEVRFFTPSCEIDFCGHATVASFFLMQRNGLLRKTNLVQKTRAGLFPVQVADDGEVWMGQALPQIGQTLDAASIADPLGISPEEIGAGPLPVQIVSTGLSDIIVPLKCVAALNRLRPDFAAMKALNARTNTVGIHAFALGDTDSGVSAFCRNFAPLFGINEESATGSASGALAGYLSHHLRKAGGRYVFEQGRQMGRPSRISAEIGWTADAVDRVTVGGHASLVETRTLEI